MTPEFDPLYLDHAASSPLHPEALEAMLPYLKQSYGNPSSIHRFGREARAALTAARDSLAALLGCASSELVFTSGGTESDNLALLGAAHAVQEKHGAKRRRIVTTAVEHHAVLHAADELERRGFEVVRLPVGGTGRVDVDAAREAIDDTTAVVSVMYANNEVGTLQPVGELGEIARERGALFHVDAVQAFGHVPIDLSRLPVDLMSFSAHKVNGPKGVGLLYVSRRTKLSPLLFGGTQERGRRAGTENVAGAVGFAKAAELACANMDVRKAELESLREGMLAEFARLLPEGAFIVNGHDTERVPHVLNVSFPGTSSETMLMNLDLEGIAASSGSACSAGSLRPSHVLEAMGIGGERLASAIRFSFGLGNCLKSVTFAAAKAATLANRRAY